MISRNKGILSLDFLVPNVGLLFAIISVQLLYSNYVTPRAEDLMLKRRVLAAQGSMSTNDALERPFVLIIKDKEPSWEITFCLWGMIVLGYKLIHIYQERKLFAHDFVRDEYLPVAARAGTSGGAAACPH